MCKKSSALDVLRVLTPIVPGHALPVHGFLNSIFPTPKSSVSLWIIQNWFQSWSADISSRQYFWQLRLLLKTRQAVILCPSGMWCINHKVLTVFLDARSEYVCSNGCISLNVFKVTQPYTFSAAGSHCCPKGCGLRHGGPNCRCQQD